MELYKVNDRVKIAKNLQTRSNEPFVTSEMKDLEGKITEITEINNNGEYVIYKVKGSTCWFVERMFKIADYKTIFQGLKQ